MQLYISSGRHAATDVDQRIQEIESVVDGVDVVFIEDRKVRNKRRTRMLNWIAAPVSLISISVWLVFLRFLPLILTGDEEILQRLENAHDPEVYSVDKPVHSIFSEQRHPWGIANWSTLVVPVLLPLIFPSMLIFVLSGALIVFAACSLMMSFLASTHSERNLYMFKRMDELAHRNEFETACLITGGRHDAELRELIRYSNTIELIDTD